VDEMKKVGFVVRHASDDPETATLPFMLAVGAMAMGVEPVVILQNEGVRLGVKGYAETVSSEGMQPLEALMSAILEAGHRIMVCGPCTAKRGIAEEDLRDGVFVGGAGMVVTAMLECENMLTY
jgi:predicted peroxiredoxin